jgi:sigma-B regulation protein RsbU (phosphoserine phosphatase)
LLRFDLVGREAAGVGRAQDAMRAWLADQGLCPAVIARAELLVEEVALNILRHGFESGAAAALVVSLESGRCVLEFEDRGMPFDPTTAALPPRAASLAQAPDGGRGLRLLRALTAEARYARSEDGRNLLRLVVAEAPTITP